MWQLAQKYIPAKLTVAFARHHFKFVLGNVTDDIRWNIIGDQLIQGKVNFAEALEQMKNDIAVELATANQVLSMAPRK